MSEFVAAGIANNLVAQWKKGSGAQGLEHSKLLTKTVLMAMEVLVSSYLGDYKSEGLRRWRYSDDELHEFYDGYIPPVASMTPWAWDLHLSLRSLLVYFEGMDVRPANEVAKDWLIENWLSGSRVQSCAECGYHSARVLQLVEDFFWRRMDWDLIEGYGKRGLGSFGISDWKL